MAHRTHPRALFALSPLAAAAALTLALPALAQDAAVPATTTTITVTGRTPAPAVSGFGNQPLSSTPISARVLGEAQLEDTGSYQLSDLTRLDASVSDAYNAEGYYGNLSMRGYVLDNRFNYRRDGLPINAETFIPLGNKASIELLKGASGIQAGTSSPGGLVNYVVKRPDRFVRSAAIGWRENGTVAAAADLSQRFGEDERYGLRLNVGAERLRPQIRDLRGERHLLALAGDVKLTRDTLLELEFEHSRQSQPSLPAFSMLGAVVPDAHAIDPRTNLNNQPWSQPVVFNNNAASVRLTHKLDGGWKATAHAMTQRIKTDDRLAFPYGCTADGNFDRYCSDGSFDLYDYRSDNERRRSDALDLSVAGGVQTGAISHDLTAGVLFTRFESRLQPRLDDGTIVGQGTIDGRTIIPTLPALKLRPNTNRDERSTELYVRDAVKLTERWSGWLGLRHTRMERESVRTDGSRPTDYSQSFTTPWAAVSYAFAPQHLVYASWGQGVESYVVPNQAAYDPRAGLPLPAQKSRQTEVGLKGRGAWDMQWTLAAFDVDRPYFDEVAAAMDGRQRHRGVEALVERRTGAWQLMASVMALRARVEDNSGPANGSRPTNVPSHTLRLMAGHDVGALPGLNLQGWLVYEGDRTLLPAANSPRIGGWARVDLTARYTQRLDGNTQLTWRAGVDNLFDRRAWRESPYQFQHSYLYPMAPRTLRASVQVDF